MNSQFFYSMRMRRINSAGNKFYDQTIDRLREFESINDAKSYIAGLSLKTAKEITANPRFDYVKSKKSKNLCEVTGTTRFGEKLILTYFVEEQL